MSSRDDPEYLEDGSYNLQQKRLDFDKAKREVQNYLDTLTKFLLTGKNEITSKLYMRAYTCIVRLSDENDKSFPLVDYYREVIKNFLINEVYPSLNQKKGDSMQFLAEISK